MNIESLSANFVVPCYDTDLSYRLRPSSFMDFAQEYAQQHANLLGFGYDDLQKTRTVWVLSRMHIRFLRHPEWREEVRFTTWHKGLDGLFYLRDFQMDGMDGVPAVVATSSWLVLNIDTRRIVRTPELDGLDSASDRQAIAEPCPKVRIPSALAAIPVAEHVVSYSDVDMNGHTNNARYIVWAMDALDYSLTSSEPVKEVLINFNHETRPGEKVTLMHAQDGDVHYVEGRVGDRSAFCAEFIF